MVGIPNKSLNGGVNLVAKQDYLVDDDFFMGVAYLMAELSKDPCTQLGACIVDERGHIVSTGYNGMPFGCNDDEFPWGKHNEDPLQNKSTFVCHAEANAILNKHSHDLENCTMYLKLFPCSECAKLIVQARIKKIIYTYDEPEKTNSEASKIMFDAAFIEYRQHVPKTPTIRINLKNAD
ncbi:GSCOCG00001033001-RA-CDS [Cotesia congregata]|nr:GSCOCG00001033001-RA-CDS [Cotesia congregata]